MSQLQEYDEFEQPTSDSGLESGTRKVTRYGPPLALPTLVGVAVLLVNVVVVFKQWRLLVPNNLTSATFATLIGSSILLGAFLLVYAKVMKRAGEEITGPGKWLLCWIVVPLVVGSLAMFAAFSSLATVNAQLQQNVPKPCIQLYQQAAGIRDVSPGFRMPENDRDERRCKINQAVLR